MVTSNLAVPGFSEPVVIHRNDDWSGLVVVEWTDEQSRERHIVELPAQVFLWVSFKETKAVVVDELVNFLANLKGGPDDLGNNK